MAGLDSLRALDGAVKLDIVNLDGDPIDGAWLMVFGPDAYVVQDKSREIQRRRLAKTDMRKFAKRRIRANDFGLDPEQVEQEDREIHATMIESWGPAFEEAIGEATLENKMKMLAEYPSAFYQLKDFVEEYSNFLPQG